MRIGIATDHSGYGLKQELVVQLRAPGQQVIDFGAHSLGLDDDYPDYVTPLARAVAAGQVERGARPPAAAALGHLSVQTRFLGVRAALIHDHFSARQGVEDDHMILSAWGGRTVGPAVAWDLVQAFLGVKFSQAERHLRRLGKLASLEETRGVRGQDILEGL